MPKDNNGNGFEFFPDEGCLMRFVHTGFESHGRDFLEAQRSGVAVVGLVSDLITYILDLECQLDTVLF